MLKNIAPLIISEGSSQYRERATLFIILLKFSTNFDQAPQFMDGHKEWIKRGFDEDIFLLVGSIQSKSGGAIVAHNASLAELQQRVDSDPFVSENIVSAEIIEITPSKTDMRLDFLLGNNNQP